MSGLTWIHLSDWHQKGRDFDRQVVRDRLMEDIKNRTAISPDRKEYLEKIDFIVFSGDVAHSGKADEYEAARRELFEPLLKACGVSHNRLFIVPGNHDLDRKVIEYLQDDLKKPLESAAQVQKWLTDDHNRKALLRPFEAFAGFVTSYTGQENPDYGCIYRFKKNSDCSSLHQLCLDVRAEKRRRKGQRQGYSARWRAPDS